MTQRYDTYKESGVQWLGEIPGHWGCVYINRLFNIKAGGDVKPELYSEKQDETHPFPVYTNTKTAEEVYAYTSLATCPSNSITVTGRGEVGHAIFRDTPYDAIVRLLSLTPKSNIICKFYAYFIDTVIPFTSDSAAIGQLSAVQIKQKQVTLPPLSEQRAIVTYLDAKCGKIDKLLEGKQKQIELLAEMKQRIIADAVTRGLNPNVKMKATNIPWLPEIPGHWEILRNKSFMKLTDEKVGNRKDITLLSLTKQGVIVRDLSEGKGKFPKDFESYLVVQPNNLVFCLFDIDETPRTVGLVRNYGMLTGAYTNFEINENIVLPEFAYYYYLQVDDVKGLRPYYTGLRKVVKTNTFLQLRMPIPPMEEQKAIVDYINDRVQKIDELTSILQSEIGIMREYKQRLISDVVTGQIKVCG